MDGWLCRSQQTWLVLANHPKWRRALPARLLQHEAESGDVNAGVMWSGCPAWAANWTFATAHTFSQSFMILPLFHHESSFFWSSCLQTILLLIKDVNYLTSPSSCQSLTTSNIPFIHCSSNTLVGLPLHLSWWHPRITLSSLIFPSPCFFIFSSSPSQKLPGSYLCPC